MHRIEPYVPLSHGSPRVDDRRIAIGVIFVIRTGLRWRDADLCRARCPTRQARPAYDRCHPSQAAPDGGKSLKKGALPRRIGRTKGGLNSKLHAVCDSKGRPLIMLLSEGQIRDSKGLP
jgi:transposase